MNLRPQAVHKFSLQAVLQEKKHLDVTLTQHLLRQNHGADISPSVLAPHAHATITFQQTVLHPALPLLIMKLYQFTVVDIFLYLAQTLITGC